MNNEVLEQLIQAVGAGNVIQGEPLDRHTTFRVGGPADAFVMPETVQAVADVARICRVGNVPLYLLGCGSNVLVADSGLRGVVMRIGSQLGAIDVTATGTVHAQAGATNAKVARAALDAGLTGYEFAAGIPGSIGGAAIMNAGAYDGELRHVATGVTCLTAQGTLVERSAAEAAWSYRHSSMADDGSIVLAVDLQLEPGERERIKERMKELAKRRADKQPLDLPSAGSTFKRPEGHYAGKLIQDAGMQGHAVGGAQVSTKHAGFVVNTGGATAADILQVIHDVQDAVFGKFGIELEPEVRCWGF